MRRALLSAVVVGLFAVPAIGMTATKSVSVRDNSFSPKSLTISKGDTVRWRWTGRAPHNVSGRGFRSRTQRGGTYSRRFRSSGRFRVVCTLHNGMAMTVRVR